jgi:hypothetical protein
MRLTLQIALSGINFLDFREKKIIYASHKVNCKDKPGDGVGTPSFPQ